MPFLCKGLLLNHFNHPRVNQWFTLNQQKYTIIFLVFLSHTCVVSSPLTHDVILDGARKQVSVYVFPSAHLCNRISAVDNNALFISAYFRYKNHLSMIKLNRWLRSLLPGGPRLNCGSRLFILFSMYISIFLVVSMVLTFAQSSSNY